MARANLVIDQGADFYCTLTLKDTNGNTLNLSSYSGITFAQQSVSPNTAFFSINTTLSTNTITLSVPGTLSANLPTGKYIFNTLLTDMANNTIKAITGYVTIIPSVLFYGVPEYGVTGIISNQDNSINSSYVFVDVF